MTADPTTGSEAESGTSSETGTDNSTQPESPDIASRPGMLARLDAWLTSLRADDTRRRSALLCALLVGLILAWIHWVGLVLAGALVGLTRRRLRWAVTAGLALGTLTVVGTPVVAPAVGVGEFLGFTPVNYVTAAVALMLPAWGALIRYVI